MSKDFDEINPDNIEAEQESRLFKWLGFFMAVFVFTGFCFLAWYAYNSETSTAQAEMQQENLELVKADSDSIKEEPVDPGGQQFPHQDKTVFSAISGAPDKAPVERILPASEEPMDRSEKPETETWMNDKLAKKSEDVSSPVATEPDAAASVEAAPASDVQPAADAQDASKTPANSMIVTVPTSQFQPSTVKNTKEIAIVSPIRAVPVPPESDSLKSEEPVLKKNVQKPSEDVTAREPVKHEPTIAKVPPSNPSGKSAKVQLGAFKSQAEAEQNLDRISGKFASKLAGKEHRILQVSLPKGTFFRLQVLPFESAAAAQAFCDNLSAAGQPCFVAGK